MSCIQPLCQKYNPQISPSLLLVFCYLNSVVKKEKFLFLKKRGFRAPPTALLVRGKGHMVTRQ